MYLQKVLEGKHGDTCCLLSQWELNNFCHVTGDIVLHSEEHIASSRRQRTNVTPNPLFLSFKHTHSYLNITGPAPHVPLRCCADTLNFFDEFPGWKDLIENASKIHVEEKLLNIINITLTNMSERYPNCQKALFDFPLYYIGT